MKEQDKKELLSRNHNIVKLASQMRDEIDHIRDMTWDIDYSNVYSVIFALSDRIDSICEYVEKGLLKGDNSKEELHKIYSILNGITIGIDNFKIYFRLKVKAE